MCKVSVIIPVYNVEEYLKEMFDSLINQDMKEFEVILIDDGSTDRSFDILSKYSGKYEYIKVYKQNNSGPSKARNKGLSLAKGEYIIFMDSDDILPLDSLSYRYNLAKELDLDIGIFASYRFDNEKEWPMKTHFLGEGYKRLVNDKDLLLTLGPWNKIFKSSIIKGLKFPEDIKYAEDQVFVMTSYMRANNIYASNKVVYKQRIRSNNLSLTSQIDTNSDKVLFQVNKAWKKINLELENKFENKIVRDRIKENYFNRLLDYDIWPALKKAIIKGNKVVKLNALNNMEYIINEIDIELINNSRKLRWIIGQGIINKYLFLTKNTKKRYVEILAGFYNKFDSNSKSILETENIQLYKCLESVSKNRSSLSIAKYLFRRKIGRLFGKVKNTLKKSTKIAFYFGKVLSMNEKRVILASNKGEELQGNLKCIYEQLKTENKYEIKLYMKNDSRTTKELINMYLDFARSKYVVLDDYYRQIYGLKFRKKAEVIQVWHACGAFKKFGFSSVGKGDGNPKEFEEKAHASYTKVITSSESIVPKYAEAFNISEKNILPLGVPRTDILLDEAYRLYTKHDLMDKYPIIKDRKVILYAPTFRGNPKERQNFKLELNTVQILKELGEEYVLMLKLHPSVKNGLKDVIIPKELENRVINIDSSSDINDLIISSEIVITDYSSVVFEAALLEKKIIMYAYDKEEYLAERDFYYDYDSFVPGMIASKNEDIVRIVKNNEFDIGKVVEFKKKFVENCDGQASKRFVEAIFK